MPLLHLCVSLLLYLTLTDQCQAGKGISLVQEHRHEKIGVEAAAAERRAQEQATLLHLSSLSFEAFVGQKPITRPSTYARAFAARPEVQAIDWHDSNGQRLAQSLVKLRRPEADRSWHQQLSASFRRRMKDVQLDKDQIQLVQSLITTAFRRKSKKEYATRKREKDAAATSGEAKDPLCSQSRRKKQKDLAQDIAEDSSERTSRGAFQLSKHIAGPFLDRAGQRIDPTILYKQALEFKDHFASPVSFGFAVSRLWKDLGYKEEELALLKRELRNRSFSHWRSRRKGGTRLSAHADAIGLDKSSGSNREATEEDLLGEVDRYDGTELPFQNDVSTSRSVSSLPEALIQQPLYSPTSSPSHQLFHYPPPNASSPPKDYGDSSSLWLQ